MINSPIVMTAQELSASSGTGGNSTIYMDAICFRGNTDTAARVDVYVLVPYASLQFMRHGSVYKADYQAVITVRDSSGKEIQQKD
ncbi:MAG: hypothetical protein IPM69_07905 [Ignavibacteria bacterium]|nr:hypothetical protein [Ignavibacteria bacterium]